MVNTATYQLCLKKTKKATPSINYTQKEKIPVSFGYKTSFGKGPPTKGKVSHFNPK